MNDFRFGFMATLGHMLASLIPLGVFLLLVFAWASFQAWRDIRKERRK